MIGTISDDTTYYKKSLIIIYLFPLRTIGYGFFRSTQYTQKKILKNWSSHFRGDIFFFSIQVST